MRKGQGLSLKTIVIAALALLVLVVLSAVFISNVPSDTRSCSTVSGGTCQENPCGDGMVEHTKATCPEEDQRCCIPVGEQS